MYKGFILTTEIKMKRDFCLYRVGRKRRRTQSLRADEIMRSNWLSLRPPNVVS